TCTGPVPSPTPPGSSRTRWGGRPGTSAPASACPCATCAGPRRAPATRAGPTWSWRASGWRGASSSSRSGPGPTRCRGPARGGWDEFAAARVDFAEAERLLGDAPDETAAYGLLVNRGVLATRQGEHHDAVAFLERAVRLKPREYPAYLNLARAYQTI